MSLKSIFASVAHAVGIGSSTTSATISAATVATLHQLGTSLAGSIAATGDRSNPIGEAVSAAIKASDEAASTNPSMTSKAKLTSAIATVAPVIIAEAAKVGITGVEAEAERFAEMAIENALSILKLTPLARLAAALLHDIGVNI